MLHLQRAIGNHAVQRWLQAKTEDFKASPVSNASTGVVHDFCRVSVRAKTHTQIQPKRPGRTAGDRYEQEADRVTNLATRISEPTVQREFEPEDEEILQTKERPGSTPELTSHVHAQINATQSRGLRLPDTERAYVESSFGHEFASVSVHTEDAAAVAGRAVNAPAERDLVFNRGQYSTGMVEGGRLRAHELTHIHRAGQAPALHRQEDDDHLPEGTSRCSAAQRRTARPTLGDANQALSFARRAVMRGDATVSLQAFFGESKENYATLVERLEAMHDSLQGRLSADELLYTEHCSEFMSAYTTPDNAYIVLCPRFFAEDTTHTSRVGTLIHEAAHTVLGVHTDIYRGEPIYDRLDEISTRKESSGSVALQNPDTIAAFVLTVASGRWPELAPEEDEMPVSHEWQGFEGEAGEMEQAAFDWALVWGRQWLHWARNDIKEMLSGSGSEAWRSGTEQKLKRYALLVGAEEWTNRLLDASDRMNKPLIVDRISETKDGSPASWTFELKVEDGKRKVEHTVQASDAFFSAGSTESRIEMLLEALRRTDANKWPPRLFEYVIDNAQRHLEDEDLAIDSE